MIWTIDAFNTSPTLNSFRYDHVKSSNNSWSNRTAVSAHYNGAQAYEYFRNTHNRNSVNGSGGNLISFINVADENGRPMDNAFWNGKFMFLGNGDQAFKILARAKDVTGHEMSHGVIQNTANLEYYGESGAMNESFADVFGAMIDRDDWLIGEDVVQTSAFPSGALRNMRDPHNGGNSSNYWWQPKHVNEQFLVLKTMAVYILIAGFRIMHTIYLFKICVTPVYPKRRQSKKPNEFITVRSRIT